MSYEYRVELIPQSDFFFGGEYTFAKDDTRKESSRYSATSTYFPQQSALLGMLRKTLLIQNGNLTMHIKGEWVDSRGGKRGNDKNYYEAAKIAGKRAFSYEDENDFGIIEKISPLFITHNNIAYTINAKDANYEAKRINATMNLGNKSQEALIFDGYNPKKNVNDIFIGEDNSLLEFDAVFQEVQTVGIKKMQNHENQEDSFFQKSSYKLKDNTTFTFFLTLSEELSWKSAFVTLGADQSTFVLKLSKTDKSFEKTFSHLFAKKSFDRVVLHSETLISKEACEETLFVFGKRESFRQLNNAQGKKSKRYYLLQRGSVIYTKNIDATVAALGQTHLQKAGINYFTPIKGS